MEKIVHLDEYRAKTLENRAFGPWQKRFGIAFGATTKLKDLDDATLFALAEPGEEGSEAFYELIMGVLELGPAAKFHYLSNSEQMKVVETHLFLADQTRFEMMRRLGWLKSLPCMEFDLVELVLNHTGLQSRSRSNPPQLSPEHSAYRQYQAMTIGDRQVFIRQLLTEALEAFRERCDTDA